MQWIKENQVVQAKKNKMKMKKMIIDKYNQKFKMEIFFFSNLLNYSLINTQNKF